MSRAMRFAPVDYICSALPINPNHVKPSLSANCPRNNKKTSTSTIMMVKSDTPKSHRFIRTPKRYFDSYRQSKTIAVSRQRLLVEQRLDLFTGGLGPGVANNELTTEINCWHRHGANAKSMAKLVQFLARKKLGDIPYAALERRPTLFQVTENSFRRFIIRLVRSQPRQDSQSKRER